MASILRKISSRILYHIKLDWYWIKLPYKVSKIRQKEKIRVLFVISELSCWKSELLYIKMLSHPRFVPLLGVSTIWSKPDEKGILCDYLESKNYKYFDLDKSESGISQISPDIVFYYKPYPPCYSKGHFYSDNLQYVFCGMDYCFSVTKHPVHMDKDMWDYCYQFYVEHDDILKRKQEVLGYRSRNIMVTGVPMQDMLLLPKEEFVDSWKDKTGKKRIIYAPHHSIKGTNGEGVEFATFLDYGEFILSLAKKYSDQITIAFKPHPNLYSKLIKIWGKERTDLYYNFWKTQNNTQLETGEYMGLFKYSDAIIHDSASFIVEYLYMNNPSMYLVAETNKIDDMFDFVQQGYYCYEHGTSVEEIEEFVINLLHGVDNKKQERQLYIKNQLMPPGGKTACDNIINAIIGE